MTTNYTIATGSAFHQADDLTPRLAEVTKRDEKIRNHPVEWLALSKPSGGTYS